MTISGLELGLELSRRAARAILSGPAWSRLGLLVFKDEDLLRTERVIVTPEVFLIAMALSAREMGLKPVLLLNARRESLTSPLHEDGLSALLRLLKDATTPLYFGACEECPLARLERAKLSMEWLALNPCILASTIEEATPVRREVKEVEIGDLEALSKLLIEKLGPPSFKEDLLMKIKGADRFQVAGDALGALASVVSPTSAITTGLRYAAKLIQLIRERRREEYRAMLEEWKKHVEEGFSLEKLATLVGEGGLEPVKHILERYGMAIIAHDLTGTIHELFLPMFLANLASELSDEVNLLIIDGASHLARFGWPIERLVSLPEEHEGLRVICYIQTGGLTGYERLPELIRPFVAERAAMFDLDPSAIEVICEGKSAAFRAALLRLLEEAARRRLVGKLALVLYDAKEAPMPELLSFRLGLLSGLRARLSFFRRSRAAGDGEAE